MVNSNCQEKDVNGETMTRQNNCENTRINFKNDLKCVLSTANTNVNETSRFIINKNIEHTNAGYKRLKSIDEKVIMICESENIPDSIRNSAIQYFSNSQSETFIDMENGRKHADKQIHEINSNYYFWFGVGAILVTTMIIFIEHNGSRIRNLST